MRVVLFATTESASGDDRPAALLPLIDRPFLQHVLEFLVSQGFRQFEVVLSHRPEQIEELLGEGARWGVSIRFHLARDPHKPYEVLPALGRALGDAPVLIGHADALPQVAFADERGDSVLFEHGDPLPSWTGWAWVHPHELAGLPPDIERGELTAWLRRTAPRVRRVNVPVVLDASTHEGLLTAHRLVLEKRFQGLMLGGREVEPGIWLARNVVLHPSARVVAPAYIAQDCRIGRNVRIGPVACIGERCLIDDRCAVTNAVIFPSGYVGQDLELADSLVDGARLVNVRLGAESEVDDRRLLASLSERTVRQALDDALSRLTGFALLLLTAPVMIVTAAALWLAGRRPLVSHQTAVRTPVALMGSRRLTIETPQFCEDPPRCGVRDLLFRVVPGLISVARGDLRLVGITPRSEDAFARVPREWKRLLLAAHTGLIGEWVFATQQPPAPEDAAAFDVCYSAARSNRHDLLLLATYASRLFTARDGARSSDARK